MYVLETLTDQHRRNQMKSLREYVAIVLMDYHDNYYKGTLVKLSMHYRDIILDDHNDY